jgi:tRNA (mo5U34)-methyltransferase
VSERRVFDQSHYESLNESRATRLRELLPDLGGKIGARTALDVGCGFGYFSKLLHTLGLNVTAIDGRSENVKEASRRVPEVEFHTMDAEDHSILGFGTFDIVLCFGLLYHLENPFLAIRHLRALTSAILFVESVIFPGEDPVMGLVDENLTEDQGLNHVAFYPTESCLVKLFYRSGFPFVYRLASMPDHPHFRSGPYSRQARTMLTASTRPLDTRLLRLVPEPKSLIEPWDPCSGAPRRNAWAKLRGFAGKPLPEKLKSIKWLVKE